jgi:hypothetical protein
MHNGKIVFARSSARLIYTNLFNLFQWHLALCVYPKSLRTNLYRTNIDPKFKYFRPVDIIKNAHAYKVTHSIEVQTSSFVIVTI